MTVHTTMRDLIDREIVPALTAGEGVSEAFDVEAFVRALRESDLIVYVQHPGAAQRDGFQIVATPEQFWTLVEQHDRSLT